MPKFITALLCLAPIAAGYPKWTTEPKLLVYWLVMGTIAFVLYGMDKRRAVHRSWRIPEKSLHLFALLGGWSGALLGQQGFRHKTRKLSFQLWFWLMGVLQLALMIDWAWFEGKIGQMAFNNVIS